MTSKQMRNKQEFVSYKSFIDRVIDIDKALLKGVKETKPNNWTVLDLRYNIYGRLHDNNINTMYALYSSIELFEKKTDSKEWWEKEFNQAKELYSFAWMDLKGQRLRLHDTMLQKIKIDFLSAVFNIIESGLRLLVRKIPKGTIVDVNGGAITSGYFSSIVSALANNKNQIITDGDKECLSILMEIRNTQHNNGIYISEEKQNGQIIPTKPMPFNGTTYVFENERNLDFLNYNFISELNLTLIPIIDKILNHDKIRTLNRMYDPAGVISRLGGIMDGLDAVIDGKDNPSNFDDFMAILKHEENQERHYHPDSKYYLELNLVLIKQGKNYERCREEGNMDELLNRYKTFTQQFIDVLQIGVDHYNQLA